MIRIALALHDQKLAIVAYPDVVDPILVRVFRMVREQVDIAIAVSKIIDGRFARPYVPSSADWHQVLWLIVGNSNARHSPDEQRKHMKPRNASIKNIVQHATRHHASFVS